MKTELSGYYPLVALLCQINLAKIVPAGFLQKDSAEEGEVVLLKARFVFWVNTVIHND